MKLTNAEQTEYELEQTESNIEQAEIELEQAEIEPEQTESEPEQTEEEMKQTESESGQAESKAEQPDVKLYALSAVLLDATNNRILYEKNADQIMPMASTTKIMTAIIALENGNMDDVVTVSKKAASMPKVHLGMREGEQYYLKDLMKSLMLESHNDSAVAIAEHIGQSVEGFAKHYQKAEACNQTPNTPNVNLFWALDVALEDYREPIPGARHRIEQVLRIMLTAWIATRMRQEAESMLAGLE